MQIDNTRKCGGKRLSGIASQGGADLPLVTVITAVFNGQPYLAGCLESVLRQDYPHIEHLVLDGGSRDGTLGILQQYDDRIELWRSEPDSGIYDAWNKALREARGEWICFLGADDEFLPGAVSAYMAFAAENPRAEYLSSRARLVSPSGQETIIGRPWAWREFSRRMHICHVGSMHKKSLFQRFGQFDASYRIAGDYEFLLRPRSELLSAFLPAETVLVRSGGVCNSFEVVYESHRAKREAGGLAKPIAFFDLSRDVIRDKTSSLAHFIFDRVK